MVLVKLRYILIPFLTFCIIIVVAAAVIAYGRGYRLDVTKKSLAPTGLVVVNSDPQGAQILVDSKLVSATNNTINLDPSWYTVSIIKEGYQPWEKKIRVQGEVVNKIDAFLLPVSPSLSALTTVGVANPSLSPDGSSLAYAIPKSPETIDGIETRAGVWVLDLTDKPLGINRDARRIARSQTVDFSSALLFWSPDSKEILASVTNPVTKLRSYYLLNSEEFNPTLEPIFSIDILEKQWNELRNTRAREQLLSLKPEFIEVASSSMNIVSFSPDETKILYEPAKATTLPPIINPALLGTNSTEETRGIALGNIYVYDIKEDKNYLLGDKKSLGFAQEAQPQPTPTTSRAVNVAFAKLESTPLMWLPASRHLLKVGKDSIEIMEYDGTNKKIVYSGPFRDGFVVPWTSGSKLVILTNLNQAASAAPNLYTVNIR